MVTKYIKKASPGVNITPLEKFQETVQQISIPLAKTFNLSLNDISVPFQWIQQTLFDKDRGTRQK